MIHACSARALAALAGSIAALGCAVPPSPPETSYAGFDRQACAEEALRRRPDPALMAEVAERSSATCRTRDATSCSLLGVIAELGLGVERDRGRARSLYRRACAAGNTRACGNLGELLLADRERVDPSGSAIALLQESCDAGNVRHCRALAGGYAEGAVIAQAPSPAD